MNNVQRIAGAPTNHLKPAHAFREQAAGPADGTARAHNDPGTVLATAAGAAVLAKGIIRARHQRSRFLPSNLFSDPAWDLLLALYAAEIAQRRTTVGQLCAAANVPATTGLRWLSTLEESGLVERRADPLDARRFFVSLTKEGSEGMGAYLQSMKEFVLAA